MSTYLKLDTKLPAGLNYLNINLISLPSALVNVGNITNAFVFKDGLRDLVGNSEIIGSPVKNADGYEFGPNGYIDTKLTESKEFLWVSLAKVPASVETTDRQFAPLISSWVRETISPTGFTLGNNMGVKISSLELADNASSNTTVAHNSGVTNADADKWILVALSRINTASGYSYYFSSKLQGAPVFTATANGTASRNKSLPVYVGHSKTDDGLFPSSKTVNFASIHNKGLTASELGTLMSSLIGELSIKGIVL